MKKDLVIKLNAWVICGVLLLTNILTVILWQPWSSKTVSDRVISVTGSTTIQAEPDEFTFSPYYQKKGDDLSAINVELTELASTITNKLKELGVKDSSIKYDVNNYDYSIYYGEQEENTSTLYFTVTINDKVLAQSVLDYITTTSPSGSITPSVSFSDAKQKELEKQARSEAIADAKQKAEASAEQLGAKLGRLATVSDGYNFGGIYPMYDGRETVSSQDMSKDTSASYTIQPGLNEYNFTVNVTYEIK